jgi:hypothetical protein
MSEFMSAYRRRMISNHQNLIKLAEELVSMGCVVRYFSSKKSMLGAINVYDKDMSNGVRVQFYDVPYRWVFEYDINPSEKRGSGYVGERFYQQTMDELPFTAEDIIGEFRPMFIDKRFEHMYKEYVTEN